MGLLGDSWDDPKTMATMQLAAGLLGGGNFGQAAARGLAGYQAQMTAAQEQEMRRQYMQAQRENMASEIEARKLAQRKYEDQQKFIQSVFGGGGGQQASAGSASSGGMGQTMPAQMQRGVLGNLSPDDVARLKLAGVDIADIYKYANEPQKMEQGSTYKDRMTGQERFMPKVDAGIAPGANGFYEPLPGYANAQAAIEAAKAGAVSRAQSANQITTVDMPDGSKRPMPLNSVIDMTRPQGQPPYNPGQPIYPNKGNANLSTDLVRAILEDAQANGIKDPLFNFDAPQAGQTLGVSPQRFGTPTAAEAAAQEANRVRQVEQAKVDVQPTQQRQAGIDSALNAYKLVDQALNHPGLGTATGLSGTLHPSNYIPGTDAMNFKSISKQLQGNAFLSAYAALKGGGQITEIEGTKAENAIARLQTAQSTEEYKSALKDYQSVIAQGLKRAGVSIDQGGASGGWGGDNKQPSAMQSLPSPSANKGRRIRDTSTGKTLVSNGLQWREE